MQPTPAPTATKTIGASRAPLLLAPTLLLLTMQATWAQDRPAEYRWQPQRPRSIRPATYTTGTVSWVEDDPQPPQPSPIQPVVMQRPMDNRPGAGAGDESVEGHIRLTPPGPDLLFGHRDSEGQLFERMRQEALSQSRPERIEFPREEPALTKEPYQPRAFPPKQETVEPNYTAYRRLNFEQLNFERYGWDLGFIGPFVSTGVFFKDVALLPYHMGTEICRRYEVNTGYCLPGTPVPLLLYPPEISAVGALFETVTVAGVLLAFPG